MHQPFVDIVPDLLRLVLMLPGSILLLILAYRVSLPERTFAGKTFCYGKITAVDHQTNKVTAVYTLHGTEHTVIQDHSIRASCDPLPPVGLHVTVLCDPEQGEESAHIVLTTYTRTIPGNKGVYRDSDPKKGSRMCILAALFLLAGALYEICKIFDLM